jgi:short-subunit dehydrogenase
MTQLNRKVAVVTGAGGGIGRELVLELTRRGARVAAVDIDEGRLAETLEVARVGDRVTTHVADITDREATGALPATVIDAHGVIDVLVNNAGMMQPMVPFVDLDFATIDRMIDVNLRGTINMCKAFLPHLLDRPSAHLVNVSSMGGFLPVPNQTMYGAAKAGVKLLTEGLYAELMTTQVGVTCVMPGAIATDIATNSGVTIEGAEDLAGSARMTSPRDAARTILDGVEKERLHVDVGRDAAVMHAAVRVAPRSAVKLIRSQMSYLLDQ